MRLSINLPDELVKIIDKMAKESYLSRSAYIATTISQKIQSDCLIDIMPELLKAMQQTKEVSQKIDRFLANGVIVPPCKVGDTVYMITPNGNIRNLTILNIDIKIEKKEVEMTCFAVYEFENKPCYLQIPSFKFGKTVFLTKEEAEAELKEREGNGA